MPWDPSNEYLGFSQVKPWLMPAYKEGLTYENALNDPSSIFYYYQKLIALRKEHEALIDGKYSLISKEDKVYIFERASEGKKIICILNFNVEEMDISQKLDLGHNKSLINNYPDFDLDKLKPYQAVILEV